MIKLFSAEDILTLPEFAGMNVFDLVKPENDKLIWELMYKVGADNAKDLEIYPCRHRRIDGKLTLNYAYVWWERTDPLWLKNPYSTMAARIEAQKDGDLKAEMLRLAQDSAKMQFKDEEVTNERAKYVIVDTFLEDKQTIKELKNILCIIREK